MNKNNLNTKKKATEKKGVWACDYLKGGQLKRKNASNVDANAIYMQNFHGYAFEEASDLVNELHREEVRNKGENNKCLN